MTLNAFFSRLGFSEDPFQSTNASDEPRIQEYFIDPPYFTSVLGSPDQPKSQVILAPRGGGKTAQRIMVERAARDGANFLCITYDHFDLHFEKGEVFTDLKKHLAQIAMLILIHIVIDINDDAEKLNALGVTERGIIRWQAKNWLSDLQSLEFSSTIRSMGRWQEKAGDLWDHYGGKIASILNVILKKHEYGEFKPTNAETSIPDETADIRFHLTQLIKIAKIIGYKSIYILVDRIDETTWTNQDSIKSFKLIQPLITDLQTLETPGLAFKFFLWDKIRDIYFEQGARRDRVKVFELKWTLLELEKMLSRRLASFSNGKIKSMNDFCVSDLDINVHRLVACLGFGSPRDAIRICGRIIDEHTRFNTDQAFIEKETIISGLQSFSEERSDELFGQTVEQIRRVNRVTFTINYVASDVFRISTQAARQKIQQWVNSGACAKIDEVDNPGSRPLHLYGIVDPRLAIVCISRDDTELALGNILFCCNECSNAMVSDRAVVICPCGARTSLAKAKSILEICKL